MNSSQYLAHIAEDGREETVKQHLMKTAEMAAEFASAFGAEDQGYLAGISHDIGKYSDAFQKRIRGNSMRVDHSTAGALECFKSNQPFAAFAVAGHHGGIPDGGYNGDSSDDVTLWGRMKRGRAGKLESYEAWKEDVNLPKARMPEFLIKNTATQKDAVFFIRMLYSCLVDADFLSTEEFMKDEAREETNCSMEELEQKIENYTRSWFPPFGELNALRCSILQTCVEKGKKTNQGLYTLTVPTGGGKTVSSLGFAVSHARKNHMKRVIYVIPYTSIIEQNAKVFRKILGDEVVLEHHSGVLFDMEQEADPEQIRLAQAAENWDMPVIVTTAVQFFESLFSNRSSKCRKLHNIADSVIIFDEAQMMPLSYLRPCIYAISQLVAHYHASAVLCTATQPALASLFHEFLPEFSAEELCPKKIIDAPLFRRVTFKKRGKITWDQLADEMNKNTQVLCIVNSRKGAQEVYKRLEGDGCFHLSTLMCPAHRENILEEIRQRLIEHKPCKVVSTSLIEAGVDVDFPMVYREEAGLDSILQAAGRCNREGKRKAEESPVYIFEAEMQPPRLFSAQIGAEKEIARWFEDLESQEAIKEYFYQLFDLSGADAQDQKNILDLTENGNFPFRRINELFHLIESQVRTVYIPWGEGMELIEQFQDGMRSRVLYRKLGRYSVSIYEGQFKALWMAGALEELEDGSLILINSDLYSETVGLEPETDSGNALFI